MGVWPQWRMGPVWLYGLLHCLAVLTTQGHHWLPIQWEGSVLGTTVLLWHWKVSSASCKRQSCWLEVILWGVLLRKDKGFVCGKRPCFRTDSLKKIFFYKTFEIFLHGLWTTQQSRRVGRHDCEPCSSSDVNSGVVGDLVPWTSWSQHLSSGKVSMHCTLAMSPGKYPSLGRSCQWWSRVQTPAALQLIRGIAKGGCCFLASCPSYRVLLLDAQMSQFLHHWSTHGAYMVPSVTSGSPWGKEGF